MRYAVLVCALAACGGAVQPAVSDVRMVAMPSKPADCPIELVTVQPMDMAPGARFGGGGGYQMIGAVTLGLDKNVDVMSEPVRALVRPRVCAMGGEVVSLLAAGAANHLEISGNLIRTVEQTDVVFTVWAHAAAAPAPQKF
jgi:hypothetical protein